MNSRQSHKPRGKKKGSLRFAEGKRTTTVGQTFRQAKQFASGIMEKYGFDRNNYLGMFALIFKGKGLLTDKELASIKNPSDRAWILQLQLQLQSLKHPESAPFITKQQTIQQIEKLVTQSGYRLPKQVLIDGSHHEEKSMSSEQMAAAVDVPVKKKRGRKSKKEKELAAQILAEQEIINAAKRNLAQSKQEPINIVNKRNSPIMQRSMRQLVASIGMLAHSTSSKMNQPNPMVNDVQHTGHRTNSSQKTVNLLYKQALRDNKDNGLVRLSEQDGHPTTRANHSNVAQHVEAIRSTSVWLEQFQSGKLSLGRNDDEAVARLSGQSMLQSNPSFLNVAKLILQEVTQTPMSHRGLTQQGSHNLSDPEAPSFSSTDSQTLGSRKALKLGEGPFSEESSPGTVRFIRSLLSKHAEGQDAQASKRQPDEQDQAEGSRRTRRSESSIAKGFLSSSLQPMAINAASLTSRLPRSMHASVSSSSPSRSTNRGIDTSTTKIWRKTGDQQDTAQLQPSSHVLQEQGTLTEVVQRLQQERDEIRLQEAASSQSPVLEQLRIQQDQQEVQLRAQREELQEQHEVQQQVQREELKEQQRAQQLAQREELQEQQEVQQRAQREELQARQEMLQRIPRVEPREQQEAHEQFTQAQSQISQENDQTTNLVRERERQVRGNHQELPELQATPNNQVLGLQREPQVSLGEQVNLEEPVQQAKLEQQKQGVDIVESVILQPLEQPVKRKRGRPRKNSSVQQTNTETTKETIVESSEIAPTLMDEQSLEKTTSDSDSVGMPEQERVASEPVQVVTAYPSQVYRKPALMENRRPKAQKIQSNESWLQQLVTIQRQPSSNSESFIRSTNSVNKDGRQVITNRASAQLSINVMKPDLGADVLARSTSKLRDQRLGESTIVSRKTSGTSSGKEQRESNRLHRQQENRSVDSQSLPIQREQDVSESKPQKAIPVEPRLRDEFLPPATTPGLQVDKTSQHQIKQEDQIQSNRLVVSDKRSTGKLTSEIAAKMAEASVRSIGTLVSTPIQQRSTENREVVRLLRTTLRQAGVSNNRMADLQQSDFREDRAGAGPQGITSRQTLAAEIAAKVAQSSMTFVNSSKAAMNGPQLLQRSLRQPVSLVQEGGSLFSTEALRENRPHSAVGASEIKPSVSEQATGKPTNETTAVGIVQPASHTPLDIVRRDGSSSRVNQVKEQQASIQRKIDLGQFIARKPTLSSRTQSSSTSSSEGDATIARSTGEWMRSRLTLRAGRIENGTVTRRASGSDDTQSLEMISGAQQRNVQQLADADRKDERQPNSVGSVERTSEAVAGEVGARAPSVSENPISSSRMMDAHIEQQNSEAATQIQLSRMDGEVDPQLNQSAREVVRGKLLQRPAFVENSRQLKPNNGIEDSLRARSISNSVLGKLVQRSLGITNGVQVRRANQADNVQSRSVSVESEFVRRNLVQRSSENQIRQNARQVAMHGTEGRMDRTVDSAPRRSEQSAFGRTTGSSPTNRSVDLTNRRMIGLNTMESSNRIPGTAGIGTGNLIQRASESRIRQLINKASAQDIRQGVLQGADGEASPSRGAVNWTGVQAEHLQRRIVVDGSERAPMREAHGSENRLEAERLQVDSAEQTIRAMVSAQVEERAQGLEPAAASRAAETVSVALAARAPMARQSTSMTPRVMPLLASSAGALRAAPAGMAAASPAAAEHRLPARGTGSLIQAAASGGAAAATAGALSGASMTNSSSQGWAAAALTKPLPTQVQRLASPVGGRQADVNQGTPAMSVPMQSRMQQPSIGGSHQGTPAMSVPMQSRTQQPPIGASHQGTPAMSVPMQSRTQQPSIGASHQGTPAMSVPMQSRTQQPSIGASHQGTPMISMPMQSASQEHLASPLSMLEHKQAPTSQLANAPLDMDWLRTKTSADSEPTPTAPVDQTPPELSEEQLQELIKQLPQLDISKIADKVYREIEKKMKFERQRRGI
ncbi:hypothetical protein GC096_34800 [Paenibacillus sp. LMG 31461]|uniref:Uncharacterized protein n=1 Tax=Paenibacillus plantarum TaxID=2654975 RepID=A0ABX1XKX4_9BACL|nr:hypothetical protein [Paenibacillus plantarum]NOU69187.1 hypothetical protein [Paenibacillus plantarum]